MNNNNNIVDSLVKWLKDPFQRKEVVPLHEPILEEMKQTSEQARHTAQRIEQFPISRTIGNPRLRRGYPYGYSK